MQGPGFLGAFIRAESVGWTLFSAQGFLYIIFELVGALLAALAFCVVRPADVGGIESPGKRREQLCSYLAKVKSWRAGKGGETE